MCYLTQREDARVGKMGKTLPFVLEYFNVAFGQGLVQTGAYPCDPASPALGILAGPLTVGSFSLFAFLCLLIVSPVPGISWKLGNPFSAPDNFPSRKQALHPVAFEWIFNVSL